MANEPVIIFDCQTSGTNAQKSFIIEAGWGIYYPDKAPEKLDWSTHLIKLPEAAYIPSRVQKITGISSQPDDASSLAYDELCERFFDFRSQHKDLPLVIHYAQFERAFLAPMAETIGQKKTYYDRHLICTHKLAKRVCPGLSSYTLRALSGYFGFSTGEKKRARDHLVASAYIWRGLVDAMHQANDGRTVSFDDIKSFRVAGGGASIEQAADILREQRLALPESPGVYHFYDRSGRILYVGKAKRLKHRVNSYFRGKKSKGSHLNELLTRVSNFKAYICTSHLEALVKESDDIKAHEPPYNRLLRGEGRQISFPSVKDLLPSLDHAPDHIFFGPLNTTWSYRFLDDLLSFLQTDRRVDYDLVIWGHQISRAMAEDAKKLLFARYQLDCDDWLKLGFYIWIRYRKNLAKSNEESFLANQKKQKAPSKDAMIEQTIDEDTLSDEKKELTVDELADLIESMIKHAYLDLYRSRWMACLVNARCQWLGESMFSKGTAQDNLPALGLKVKGARFAFTSKPISKVKVHRPSQDLQEGIDVSAYDRLSILYKELRRSALNGEKLWLLVPGRKVLSNEDLIRLFI
jgi:DNA polymerase III epsilon subunit-like protein